MKKIAKNELRGEVVYSINCATRKLIRWVSWRIQFQLVSN